MTDITIPSWFLSAAELDTCIAQARALLKEFPDDPKLIRMLEQLRAARASFT